MSLPLIVNQRKNSWNFENESELEMKVDELPSSQESSIQPKSLMKRQSSGNLKDSIEMKIDEIQPVLDIKDRSLSESTSTLKRQKSGNNLENQPSLKKIKKNPSELALKPTFCSLNDDVTNKILCDIGFHNILNVMKTNKNRAEFISNNNVLWNALNGSALREEEFETSKKSIQINLYPFLNPTVQKEIDTLLENMKDCTPINNYKLKKLLYFTNLLLFWQILMFRDSEFPLINFADFFSLKELINHAEKFPDWCQNKENIPKMNEISLIQAPPLKSGGQPKLTCISKEIKLFQNVKWVDLNGNLLTEIPKELLTLPELKYICIEKNQLTSLPDEIGQNLEEIYISHNCLTEVPKSIGQLPKLNSLYVSNNKLTSLPDEIGQLKKLKNLAIGDNQLEELPSGIWELTNLEVLHVQNNQLTALSDKISQLTELKYLDLSGNPITELPKGISQLQNLETLKISNTKIKSIPDELRQRGNLEII